MYVDRSYALGSIVSGIQLKWMECWWGRVGGDKTCQYIFLRKPASPATVLIRQWLVMPHMFGCLPSLILASVLGPLTQ